MLLFLIEHAPLKPWQRDVLSIVRDEAYYFAPQGQTKIMNEGWACVGSEYSCIHRSRLAAASGTLLTDGCRCEVSDGERTRRVYDWAKFEDRETVSVRTRRGLELEGSVTHRVHAAGRHLAAAG